MKALLTAIVLSTTASLFVISEAEARKKYHHYPKYYQQSHQVIHWGSSTFYQHPNGVVYAPYYNRRVIDDLRNYCYHHRIRHFYIMPEGYAGAVPSQWRNYMYHSFARAGIQISVYQARQPYANRYYYDRHYRERDRSGFYFQFRF